MAEYDQWADFYDLIHPGLPGEAEFYVGQAARIGGDALEIGCGTGRIAIPMAMSGVNVTGLDNSSAMLERCQDKLESVGEVLGDLRLVHEDMRDFDLNRTFDFIAMPYRTFMHCETLEEQYCCLRAIRRHMDDHTLFALNLWAARPSQIAPHLGPAAGGLHFVQRYPLEEDGESLLHFSGSRYDEYYQQLAEDHLLQFADAEGRIVETRVLALVRTWVTRREMEALITLNGFAVEALMGDFSGGPFTRESGEMIWLLKKDPEWKAPR